METLLDTANRASLVGRVDGLEAAKRPLWGKMNPAQALAHCSIVLEIATGDGPTRQKLIGKLLAPLVKRSVLGEKPTQKNAPTDPDFVVAGERDLAAEKKRIVDLVERFASRGPAHAATRIHPFFGKLTGEEWGRLMYKHVDHHLQQFGA